MQHFDPYSNGSRLCAKYMKWGKCNNQVCREKRRIHRMPYPHEIPPLCSEYFRGTCFASPCVFSHEPPKAPSTVNPGSRNDIGNSTSNTDHGSFDHLNPVMPSLHVREQPQSTDRRCSQAKSQELGSECEGSPSSKRNESSQAGAISDHLSEHGEVSLKEDCSGSFGASIAQLKETESLGKTEGPDAFFIQLEHVNAVLTTFKDTEDLSCDSNSSIQSAAPGKSISIPRDSFTPESVDNSLILNGRRTMNSIANSTPTTLPDLSTVAQWLVKTPRPGSSESRGLDRYGPVIKSLDTLEPSQEKPKHPPSDAGSDYTQVTSFDEHPTWVKRDILSTRRKLAQSKHNSQAQISHPDPNMVSPPHSSQCSRDEEVVRQNFQPYHQYRLVDMPRVQEWNVLRCFNCWEDGHTVYRCWSPCMSDIEREEKRDELGVISRRWTQYVLDSPVFSIEIKKKHQGFSRIWLPYSSRGKYITPFSAIENATVSTNIGTGVDKSTVSVPEQKDCSTQVELLAETSSADCEIQQEEAPVQAELLAETSSTACQTEREDSSAQTEVVSQNCSTECQTDLQECTTTSCSQTETVESMDAIVQTSLPEMCSKIMQTPHDFIGCPACGAAAPAANLEFELNDICSRRKATCKRKEKEDDLAIGNSLEVPEELDNNDSDSPSKGKSRNKKSKRAQNNKGKRVQKSNQSHEDKSESNPGQTEPLKSPAKVVNSLFGGPSHSTEIHSTDAHSTECHQVHGQAEPCDSQNSVLSESSDNDDWDESRWSGNYRNTLEYRAQPRSRKMRYSDHEDEHFNISTSKLVQWDTIAYRLEEDGRKEVVFDQRDLNAVPLWMKEAEDMSLPPAERLKRELEAQGIFGHVPEDEPVYVTQTSGFLRLPVEILESIFKYAANEYSSQRDVKTKDIVAGYEWSCEEAVNDTQRRARILSGVVVACRRFHEVAQEYIYRHIGIDSFQSLKRLTIGLLGKPHLAKHVQSLRISMDQSSLSFKTYGRFRYLYESEEKKTPTHTDFTSAFVLIMEACINLQVVTCKMWGSALGLGCLKGQWPKLRELCVRDELSIGMVVPAIWNRLSCFPALKKFRLAHSDVNPCYDFDALQYPGIIDTIRQPQYLHLRDICLERAAEVTDEILLRVCSRLKLSRLAIIDCKLVTSGGIANVVQLSKRTLGSLTFWVWKDGQGRPHPNELAPKSSHLCATLAKGCRVIGEINLKPYRICEDMWHDCDYKYLGRLEISMICFINCKSKRISRQAEEKFHHSFNSALEDGKMPKYMRDRSGIRTHEAHFSLHHVSES
ncbi:Similar to hypothetical protein [Tuber melanosporum Mel28]; acc. no. XP_002835969 [Pyronema omphalodes CBS 100304]|uniref:C3H1-type domain-containing protein n=1 Tax=Pyronema omphalodes (strain CBS 100304) TaxID=1076935 RepID=U4KTT8_PYROM|nr:Similar to hypothetical protein [Tuber melanosporum Mel28]; acc. no. XP_002835969 [Pyronema omphalodes CBS 100304]